MLANLVIISFVCFAINFVMDRFFIENVHREVKLGLTSALFWLAGCAAMACALVLAIRTIGI